MYIISHHYNEKNKHTRSPCSEDRICPVFHGCSHGNAFLNPMVKAPSPQLSYPISAAFSFVENWRLPGLRHKSNGKPQQLSAVLTSSTVCSSSNLNRYQLTGDLDGKHRTWVHPGVSLPKIWGGDQVFHL